MRSLTQSNGDESPSSAEVFAMLHSPVFNPPIALPREGNMQQDNKVSPDLQNELFERIEAAVHKDKEKKGDGDKDSEAGKWGAVVAAIVLAIAAAAYLAMVLWRKSLE